MYRLSVEGAFAAAHQLRGYYGRCENLHGHNWLVRLTVEGETLDERGMLLDFCELKQRLQTTLDRLDHQYLNTLSPFDRINPTSENLARWIAENLELPSPIRITEVTVWESERCCATYLPPLPQ